ncbi:MAG: WbqC family protein [Bacteroidota bacterium]|jgi:hypothetical protein
MRVAVLQSNYLPWRGYFDIISRSDLFVFYDDVKFTKNDWRNRNMIISANGPIWLTIPCPKDYSVLIHDVAPIDKAWQSKHWKSIIQEYKKAPFFYRYSDFFEDFYLNHEWDSLSELNHYLIKSIATDIYGLESTFMDSRDFSLQGVKQDRLLDLLIQLGTSTYFSGPSAKKYIDEGLFRTHGIEIVWMDYSKYPVYRQQCSPFIGNVSIIDLMFNAGTDKRFISPALE